MQGKGLLYFALGVVLVVSVGAVSLHDSGIEFPDGSFQTTASAFAATNAVQGQVSISTAGGGSQCGFGILYPVPAGKRLVIEWVTVETEVINAMSAGSHPADVDVIVHNGVGEVFYPFTRLQTGATLGASLFFGTRAAAPVRLYSEENQDARARICLNKSLDGELIGNVGFSGHLIDVAP